MMNKLTKEQLKEKTKFVAFLLVSGEHTDAEIAKMSEVPVDFVKSVRENFIEKI